MDMIYSINYTDMSEKINPLAFSKYLTDTGWTKFPTKRDYIKIFQCDNNDEFYQVTIPVDKDLSDYKKAMYEAVETVAKKEKRSIEQLMLYLLNPNADILKIRLDKPDIESGNILFDDAIKIYENAKKILAATALDIINPQIYHRGRIDEAVSEFLTKCRFGQTEIGSYVVSVVCPFAELNEEKEYKQLSIFSDEEQCANSLTRQVTNRVIENILLIKKCIDEDDIGKLTELKADQNIISANFFEALNGLNLETENTKVEFIAEWSPTVKNKKNHTARITLTHDYYQPITTIIDKLKKENKHSFKILGRIKSLQSSPVVEKRTEGKICVAYLNDENKSKVVTVNLNKPDYDKAITAHAEGKYVEIVGELTTKSNKRNSMTCESFNIIE